MSVTMTMTVQTLADAGVKMRVYHDRVSFEFEPGPGLGAHLKQVGMPEALQNLGGVTREVFLRQMDEELQQIAFAQLLGSVLCPGDPFAGEEKVMQQAADKACRKVARPKETVQEIPI